MTQQPQAKYRHVYRAPDYQITDIDLTFDLDAQKTVVTAVSQAVRHGASDAPLRLNGEDLKLVSVYINDEPWTAWKEEEGALVISNLPERFTLKIINEISPAANTALEGLYQQMFRFVSTAKTSNWFLFILMMSRGPPGKKKRAHWSSVICRSVLRLRSLMK